MFNVIEKGKHGDTVYVSDPKRAAYSQMAYIANILRRHYQLVCNLDGSFTVNGDGLAPITYAAG